MHVCSIQKILAVLLVPLFVIFSGGCGGVTKGSEDRDPNVRRARDRRAVTDYEGALEYYQRAIEKRPDMARVHWEMATIHDQFFTNELRAIYHYERFLELDKKASPDRRAMVEHLIAAAKLSYAASLPVRPSEAADINARLRADLQTANAMLADARAQVEKLKAELATRPAAVAPPVTPPTAGSSAISRPAAAVPPAATPAAGAYEEYTVLPGDTLSRIAGKVYGDSGKWKPIFEANKSVLGRPENVRVGQKLRIPR